MRIPFKDVDYVMLPRVERSPKMVDRFYPRRSEQGLNLMPSHAKRKGLYFEKSSKGRHKGSMQQAIRTS